MTVTAPRIVNLRAGETTLDLAPTIGGAIAAFRWRGVDLFRPATAAALGTGDILGMSSFPMAPFAGRIREGRFIADGREVRLPVNLVGETDAIHGHGWQAPWTVVEAAGDRAKLQFDHASAHWPWDYQAEQTFTLTDGALTQSLTVTNRSPRPMPAGLGLHPYFPRPPQTRLKARVADVFLAPDQPPTAPPPSWNWTAGQAIEAYVDHQFTGWDGVARVDWPGKRLALRIAALTPTDHLVVYAPTGEDYVCVEPVSHQLDAVNRSAGGAAHGMVRLLEGDATRLTVRYEVISPT